MTGNSPPPGWYTDGQGGQRWWDGSKWYEAAEPRADTTRIDEEPPTAHAPAQLPDPVADTSAQLPDSVADPSPKRKVPKPSQSVIVLLGSAMAIAGILLAGVAIVLLVMVNPDCLNNDECGQFKQGIWELFGVKSAVLIAGLLLTGVGLSLRRRARKSVAVATRAKSTSTNDIATTLRRKRIWMPLVAVTCLALAAGTWVTVTAGPSDEERRVAAEKLQATAVEEERQAEAEAKAEAALRRETCESTISAFKAAVEAVDSKLDVGLVQNDLNNALGDASIKYDQLELDAILDDDYCVSDVVGPLEDAFNIYVKSNTKWNNCIQNFGCEVEGKVLKNLQGRWLRASLKILQADSALENYETTGSDT